MSGRRARTELGGAIGEKNETGLEIYCAPGKKSSRVKSARVLCGPRDKNLAERRFRIKSLNRNPLPRSATNTKGHTSSTNGMQRLIFLFKINKIHIKFSLWHTNSNLGIAK
jgi:hypothetical protein